MFAKFTLNLLGTNDIKAIGRKNTPHKLANQSHFKNMGHLSLNGPFSIMYYYTEHRPDFLRIVIIILMCPIKSPGIFFKL